VYVRAYDTHVDYRWDPVKAAINRQKHGIRLSDAVAVLEDELARTAPDPSSDAEDRFIAIGMDALGRILVVVYTFREDHIRIISARLADSRERRDYEANP
jgi:uncharacterized protein